MKTFSLFLIVVLFFGCQHKMTSEDYLKIRQDLLHDNFYKGFVGYQIIPRDEDEYCVILSNPEATLWVTLVRDDSVEINPWNERDLLDTLSDLYPTHGGAKMEAIRKKIGLLMSFMRKDHLWGARGSSNRDTTSYSVEFYLTRSETLRFDSKPQNPKEYDSDTTIVATWIDSNWVYLKKESH
jgi:hypothetical protein